MKYLHTMIRVLDLEKTLHFFNILGLKETRRKEVPQGKFTLVFLATEEGAPEVELTYNWGGRGALWRRSKFWTFSLFS